MRKNIHFDLIWFDLLFILFYPALAIDEISFEKKETEKNWIQKDQNKEIYVSFRELTTTKERRKQWK